MASFTIIRRDPALGLPGVPSEVKNALNEGEALKAYKVMAAKPGSIEIIQHEVGAISPADLETLAGETGA